MSKVKVFSSPNCNGVLKAQIAGKYNGVNVVVEKVQAGGEKAPEFLATFPLGKLPAAETAHGPVFEADAVAKYIARSSNAHNLAGKGFYEEVLVDQWLEFFLTEAKDASKLLKTLDIHLDSNTFLVGNQVTVADISGFVTLLGLFATVVPENKFKAYDNVARWFNTLHQRKQFKQVVSSVEFTKEAPKEEAKEEAGADAKGPKAAGKGKPPVNLTPEQIEAAARRKEQQAKEAAEKAAAKKAQQEADEEERLEKAKAKEKEPNPLDSLPPSKMVLDDVKRAFFLSKPSPPADFLKDFVSNFDASGYSLWEAKYKYNEELTNDTLADNLLVGFFNRCEAVRKYAFGCHHLSGKEENGKISGIVNSGVWLFRGTDIIKEMKEVDDFVEFDFRQLDVNKDIDLLNAHWSADKINGLSVFSRRFLK